MNDPHAPVRRNDPAWLLMRVTIAHALHEAVFVSRQEPHKVFWMHVLRCPSCHRHAVAILLSVNETGLKKPKYTLATVTNGEVIPRGLRH